MKKVQYEWRLKDYSNGDPDCPHLQEQFVDGLWTCVVCNHKEIPAHTNEKIASHFEDAVKYMWFNTS